MLNRILYCLSFLLLSGCASNSAVNAQQNDSSQCVYPSPCLSIPGSALISSNYRAADGLIAKSIQFKSKSKPILMSTIVNIDDLESSSTLGRLISEHLSGRITQNGHNMIEAKLQRAVYMKKNEGEFMLSRHIMDIASTHDVQAVVVGTYSIARHVVFVSLKLVQPQTNYVFSAVDYSIPIDDDIRNLINSDRSRSNF